MIETGFAEPEHDVNEVSSGDEQSNYIMLH